MKSRKLTVEKFIQLGGRSIRSKRCSLELATAEGLAIVSHVAKPWSRFYRFVCPAGCGRTPRLVYHRHGRWSCRRCAGLTYSATQMAHRLERALERFEQGGCNPMLMPEWVLILLAGTPD